MKYFNECKTLAEVRTLYKKLAMQHHPDRGGDTATMQEINREYAYASAHAIKGENFSQDKADTEQRFSREYLEILQKIIHLPGITIELCGHWIWVTGNTYPVKKELHEAGLLFAPKKKAWYYRSEPFKVLKGGKKSLSEIRAKYGSRQFSAQPEENAIENN
jgi:hypothetical protein